MRAYSEDLRVRIVDAVDRHVDSQGKVTALFGVSRTFVKKLLRQRCETGKRGEPDRSVHCLSPLQERSAESGRAASSIRTGV